MTRRARDPLTWWKMDCNQFPNVGFLVKWILRTLGNQIECKRIFSIIGILTNLCKWKLGLINLEALVMICKNWADGTQLGVGTYNNIVDDFFNDEVVVCALGEGRG